VTTPATSHITQNAWGNGIAVLPVCSVASARDNTLEGSDNARGQPAILLEFRETEGLQEAAELDQRDRRLLAESGPLGPLTDNHRDARWAWQAPRNSASCSVRRASIASRCRHQR
jgi:hypothetical protein